LPRSRAAARVASSTACARASNAKNETQANANDAIALIKLLTMERIQQRSRLGRKQICETHPIALNLQVSVR
jgi:hypothetical protein